MMDKQRRKAIVKRNTYDRKKEAWVQVLFTTKEKKEAERLAKLVDKKKEKKNEEKAKAKGKKKAKDGGQIPASSKMDQAL